jgi:hypothetical protein
MDRTNNKFTGVIVVFGVATVFLAILYVVDMNSESLGFAQWLNSKRILKEHKLSIRKILTKNPDFKSVDKEKYIEEAQSLIAMKGKRNLGDWVSYRSFTPNIKGAYITTNDFGLRSEIDLKNMILRAQSNKKQGKKNILLLGGSTAFGLGSTEDSKSISSLLNSALIEDGFEVFNLAQGGYTSFMQLFMLGNIGIHFQSDMIVILDGYSDIYHLAYKPKGGEMTLGLWDHHEEKMDPSFVFNLYYKNLATIGKLGAALGNEIIYALQPISGFENNSLLEVDKIEKLWALYPKVREVTQLAALENNATFLDLTQSFKKENNSEINFYDKSHLSDTGQRKLADILLKEIRALSQRKKRSPTSLENREAAINTILTKDYSGKYKTARDY